MLAFGWNDPVPALRPRAEPRSTHSTKGKHGTKNKATAGKTKSTSKSSAKSTKKTTKKH
jgi:hypothetical protein